MRMRISDPANLSNPRMSSQSPSPHSSKAVRNIGEKFRHWILLLGLLWYNFHAWFLYTKYDYVMYDHETLEQLAHQISVNLSSSDATNKPYCPAIPNPVDVGAWQHRIPHWSSPSFWTDDYLEPYDEIRVTKEYGLHSSSGGKWTPEVCTAVHQVTLIVPYRDRPKHLSKFILHMHPFLQAQLVEYRILVVEQEADGRPFNKGVLFNAGFSQSLKWNGGSHCYVLHDVDLVPFNVQNIYGCTQQPRHMTAAINSMRFMLPYEELVGGAISVTREQFQEVNGFSNSFVGWGGEDDDFGGRIRNSGRKIVRLSPVISTYRMLPHVKAPEEKGRAKLIREAKEKFETDGLRNTNYTVLERVERPVYTWLLIRVPG